MEDQRISGFQVACAACTGRLPTGRSSGAVAAGQIPPAIVWLITLSQGHPRGFPEMAVVGSVSNVWVELTGQSFYQGRGFVLAHRHRTIFFDTLCIPPTTSSYTAVLWEAVERTLQQGLLHHFLPHSIDSGIRTLRLERNTSKY